MKIVDIPKSGKSGRRVFYRRRSSQCWRVHVVPHDPRSVPQRRARRVFSAVSKAWRDVLTEPQRQAWLLAAAAVRSRPRLAQSGPLTGQMHFVRINSARARIGRELLLWPPERVVFGPNPVEQLSVTHDNGRLRLNLRVAGPVTEDIMVFGQAPCSAGWRKWRHGAYLGLLPTPVGGDCDITEMYVARFGEPKPGERVFIRTRQQTNGWEGRSHDTSALVTPKPVVPDQSRTGVSPVRAPIPSRRQAGALPYSVQQPHERVQIPFITLAFSVPCAVHKGVVPNQYRIRSQTTPLHCRPGTPRRRAIGQVGRLRRTFALGEAALNGPWYELWHHT